MRTREACSKVAASGRGGFGIVSGRTRRHAPSESATTRIARTLFRLENDRIPIVRSTCGGARGIARRLRPLEPEDAAAARVMRRLVVDVDLLREELVDAEQD